MNAEPGEPYNVFLIGYRCTGKSSVGKSLATRLGWPFIDTDSLLVSESGISIKEIVETHGWEIFRKMEHAVVKQVCIVDRRVVATGGGVVLNEANVNLMKKKRKACLVEGTTGNHKNKDDAGSGFRGFPPVVDIKRQFFRN